ncbi:MAG: NADH-quinone oxidoreductase subunit L [Melioribacteraceae bacterium]|jgi:NADH-quinone oxidoreductase subunit L|nr:NADH-quinone oxidoreductase subunit L [Melioribacteraceae bacterium]
MTESSLISLAVTILFLPLVGFAIVLLFGKRYEKLYLLEVGIITVALLLSIFTGFVKLTDYVNDTIITQFTWIDLGNVPSIGHLTVNLGIMIDNVTVIMLFVVTLISALVHYFSIAYMKGDSRFSRYFAYLGIFTFSMLGIVIADNLLMIYIFWELVGLSSYLLIGFWYEKKSASDASMKAFLTNRVGDIGMFIGILILFTNYHTFSFAEIFAHISNGVVPFGSNGWLTAAGILIFMGAVGKSAQIPLHIWLPDAMEGPTPVSALIHAATMVAAGVYLVARIFALLTADAMLVIAVVGAITSIFAASIALTQNDIKKVLAYSTVSQLGYMVMALGVGAYKFAFFHLVTHAFFKGLMFLGSGSVIYSMHHEQDMRQMGGLRKKMPITYITFLIGTLAISGVPLTSGFLSKDGLLAGTWAFGNLTGHYLIPIIGFVVAGMTAFYMFRLVIMTFHGEPNNQHKYDHAHESPKLMTVPLIILALLSIFIFYTPNPTAPADGWFYNWVKTPQTVVPEEARFEFMKSESHSKETHGVEGSETEHNENDVIENHEVHGGSGSEHVTITHSEMYEHEMHVVHYPAMILSIILAGLGILFAFLMYQWKKIDPDKLAERLKPLYNLSYNKWYIDEIYSMVFIERLLDFSRFVSWFDATIVDGVVNGSATVTRGIANIAGWFDTYVVDGLVNFTAFVSGFAGLTLRKMQTGKLQTYIVYVVFSVIIILLIIRPF